MLWFKYQGSLSNIIYHTLTSCRSISVAYTDNIYISNTIILNLYIIYYILLHNNFQYDDIITTFNSVAITYVKPNAHDLHFELHVHQQHPYICDSGYYPCHTHYHYAQHRHAK